MTRRNPLSPTVAATAALTLFTLASSPTAVKADVYMHNPRGSNNRCDESSNDVQQNTRLFDSENNNAGGYAWCPREMKFYEGTTMDVQWTHQHGCGNGETYKNDPNNPEPVQCQVVLQVGCEHTFAKLQPENATMYWPYKLTDGVSLFPYTQGQSGRTCINRRPTYYDDCITSEDKDPRCATYDLRNNRDRDTFNDPNGRCRCHPRKELTYGYHEPEMFYHKCKTRSRNRGLYTSTQNLQGDTAIFTRQTANGQRYGFECNEERDYYPYWHPTGWVDIGVKVSDTSMCSYYQSQTENQVGRCECINPNDPLDPTFWVYNTEASCSNTRGARWVCRDAHNVPPPTCEQAEWTMDNHLGMMATGKRAGESLSSYKWTIPSWLIPEGQEEARCVLRVRYNITTSDTRFNFDSTNNGALRNNPVIVYNDVNSNDLSQAIPLRYAINTAQFPRGFEDRSYVFKISRRPDYLKGVTIHNLNVRGKRGNIAQVRNNFEYDFVPGILNVRQGDYIHFQWCGSDHNDQNNAGQGLAGTDRSNIVGVISPSINRPLRLENATGVFGPETLKTLAWLNQTNCFNITEMMGEQAQNQQDPRSCHFLNNASAYFEYVAPVEGSGIFYYISSRNNAFTNRHQRGVIISGAQGASPGTVAGLALGATSAVAAAGAGALWFYKRKHGGLTGLKYATSSKL
ncbi:hypothetical protein HK102_013090 [Quaeritorhiza haematococci]|nr:hypothetical protein HK102_013090 [Quaeritorhiza haematococci]